MEFQFGWRKGSGDGVVLMLAQQCERTYCHLAVYLNMGKMVKNINFTKIKKKMTVSLDCKGNSKRWTQKNNVSSGNFLVISRLIICRFSERIFIWIHTFLELKPLISRANFCLLHMKGWPASCFITKEGGQVPKRWIIIQGYMLSQPQGKVQNLTPFSHQRFPLTQMFSRWYHASTPFIIFALSKYHVYCYLMVFSISTYKIHLLNI